MVIFYYNRLVNGKTTLSKVPIQLREAVKDMLLNNGYENLTTESEGEE